MPTIVNIIMNVLKLEMTVSPNFVKLVTYSVLPQLRTALRKLETPIA